MITRLLAGLVVLASAGPTDAELVLASWGFSRGLQGWAAGPTAHVRQARGAIVIETDGKDPILVGPPISVAPKDGDVLEVRMSGTRSGEVQWFYRRTAEGPYGGFMPDEQRLVHVNAGSKPTAYRALMLWEGGKPIIGLRFDLPEGGPGTYRVESIRILRPAPGASRTVPWRAEQRVPLALPRIDIARQAPPATRPIASDYTVAMWYFAAWEPEYTWDGWKQVAERAPWRIPLLYDSADPEMEYNGIRYYRSSKPRVLDWHVHWLREHAVNLMIWDWYPNITPEGAFSPSFFGNRALELGFLGKEQLGGPPVRTNRFAETMPFAVMWTNHPPNNKLAPGLIEYMVDQFMSQPNYYKVDGKPLLAVWNPNDVVSAAGSEAKARKVIDDLRAYARSKGHKDLYVVAVNVLETRKRADLLGYDGVMAYNYLLTGGYSSEPRRIPGGLTQDMTEDFATQATPGQQKTWERMAAEFGRDYLVATTPMQNMEPTLRTGSPMMVGHNPDLYRKMLQAARQTIEKRGLRKFVSCEAFNEWLEGSYVEPSTQWGFGYLEALRDALGKPGK
ncbi:MAG: glycoside hydrolase family 99-like domain-containing protein [Armatimonadetes bacterium]|nr:glycoside hydrolase family 99-like domain-containing protein [Armatimonadota bacterium]